MTVTEAISSYGHAQDIGAKAEIITPKPFEVRGHHLRQLLPIACGNLSPSAVAVSIGTIGDTESDRAYTFDVLGPMYEDKSNAQLGFAEYLWEFYGLPLNSPVKLMVGEKDGICKSCAIGAHCNDTRNGFTLNDNAGKSIRISPNDAADMRSIAHFTKIAYKLKKQGRLTGEIIKYDAIDIPGLTGSVKWVSRESGGNMEFYYVPPIITSSLVVREVLKETQNSLSS